jgi:hypothetical protein
MHGALQPWPILNAAHQHMSLSIVAGKQISRIGF